MSGQFSQSGSLPILIVTLMFTPMDTHPSAPSGKIVVWLGDLIFQVKIEEASRRAGLRCVFTSAPSRLREEAASGALLIVLDLAFTNADSVDLIKELKASASTMSVSILAYAPHVNIDLKARALAAGCDAVVARSAFVQNLPELLLRYAAPARTVTDISLTS